MFGLLGAAAVIMFRRGINPLTTGVGTALVLNLFITFTIPGISIGGHIGGAHRRGGGGLPDGRARGTSANRIG